MNLELFIAKRIHFSKKGKKSVSRPAVRVAVLGIALGLAVMIITVSIVIGFKDEIRNKVIAFGSHIQVSNFDSNETFETESIYASDSLINSLSTVEGVNHIQRYATKPGII
ncbi:MAG: ABC transporter permease, partial [Bacteroidales bacterium]|nr:ABC transporter permease [Bacteroidales bacterium]